MAHFAHVWQSPLDLVDTWQLIVSAFENSQKSAIWPNELSEIHVQDAKLQTGSLVAALYKVGPVKNPARYRIALFDPPRMLRYETTPEHPLKGYAVITLDRTTDGTRCRWKGEYRRKSLASILSLLWFKLYFERRFFKKFVKNFQSLGMEMNTPAHNVGA